MHRVSIVIPDFDPIQATYTDDWSTGATTYAVTAPQVQGAVVIAAALRESDDTLDPDKPAVVIELGRRGPNWRSGRDHDRAERPVIDGVDLVGATLINVDKLRFGRLSAYDVCPRRPIDPSHSERVPLPVAERFARLVDALARHWLSRRENQALRLATARTVLPAFIADKRRKAEDATKRLLEVRGELANLRAGVADAEQLNPISIRDNGSNGAIRVNGGRVGPSSPIPCLPGRTPQENWRQQGLDH